MIATSELPVLLSKISLADQIAAIDEDAVLSFDLLVIRDWDTSSNIADHVGVSLTGRPAVLKTYILNGAFSVFTDSENVVVEQAKYGYLENLRNGGEPVDLELVGTTDLNKVLEAL